MIRTRFTELVGCEHPVQQATMGGISGRRLAAAVANAGGLGMLHSFGPLELEKRCDWMDENTEGIWGIGFNALGVHRVMDAFHLAIQRASVVELSFKDPDEGLVDQIHEGGKLAFWQVGEVEAARMAIDVGVDVIVVQGTEAGGHHAGGSPLASVLEPVLELSDVPVIAAGGISDGKALAEVLELRAAGARIGTAFVACRESDASDIYREALVAAEAEDTVVTTLFGAEWPDWPHRVLRSSIEAAEALTDDPVGSYDDGTNQFELPRFSTMAPTAYSAGPHEAMAMYAGTGVNAVDRIESAVDVIGRIVEEAEAVMTDMRSQASEPSLETP